MSTEAGLPTPPAPVAQRTITPLTSRRRLAHIVRSMHPGRLIQALFLVGLCVVLWRLCGVLPVADLWSKWLEPIIGVATLIVAIMVWWNELREEWEKNLPKVLSVYFFHQDVPRLVCRWAYLAAEGDIRQMAQQVGQQMNNNQRLDLVPFLEQKPPELVCDNRGVVFKHYRVRLNLTRPPSTVQQNAAPGAPQTCRLWQVQGAKVQASEPPVEQLLCEPDIQDWLRP